MVRAEVQGTEAAGYIDNPVPEYIQLLSMEALGTKEEVEAELNAMMRAVRTFWNLEPDQVMKIAGGYSARLTELYVHLHRVEGPQRVWRQVRTQQVVPLLEEVDRQMKRASREVEIRKMDLDALRGIR